MSSFKNIGRRSRLAMFMQWVVSKLPPRLKRIVFIGLILGYFNEKKNPDIELIKKINDTFKTADSPKAYELPIAVKSILWKDFNLTGVTIETKVIDGKPILTPECKNSICDHITKTLPEWIRYSTKARIHRDTMRLINQLESDGKSLRLPV